MCLNIDGENHSQEVDSPSTSQQIPWWHFKIQIWEVNFQKAIRM